MLRTKKRDLSAKKGACGKPEDEKTLFFIKEGACGKPENEKKTIFQQKKSTAGMHCRKKVIFQLGYKKFFLYG